MSERTDISFDAALMMALRADAQRELDSLPTPKQFEEIYPDTSQWDERMTEALKKKKHHPVLKRVLIAALTLVMLTVGALAVSADFRRAVYTMIQKFLPIEMQLTYQVDGEPLEWLPDGYSDHYVPNGFEMDDVQKFERAENFLHVYSSKETEESYTVRCSIIQPGQQSLFDNEHTVYETVKVGEADGVLGTSTDEHGKNVYASINGDFLGTDVSGSKVHRRFLQNFCKIKDPELGLLVQSAISALLPASSVLPVAFLVATGRAA